MKTLFFATLLVTVIACEVPKEEPKPDSVASEYTDWYTIKAPVDEVIYSVWGDFDKTLLISTLFSTYRSTDKGKSWQLVERPQTSVMGFVLHQDTLFTMTSLLNGNNTQLLSGVDRYSIDDGKSWQPYRKYNPFFDERRPNPLLYINPVTASTGSTYSINRINKKTPTGSISSPDDTPGVITSDGRQINLPQRHFLISLYLDTKGRLYVAGTDAICSESETGSISYCNSKSGRGVVYISKKTFP